MVFRRNKIHYVEPNWPNRFWKNTSFKTGKFLLDQVGDQPVFKVPNRTLNCLVMFCLFLIIRGQAISKFIILEQIFFCLVISGQENFIITIGGRGVS